MLCIVILAPMPPQLWHHLSGINIAKQRNGSKEWSSWHPPLYHHPYPYPNLLHQLLKSRNRLFRKMCNHCCIFLLITILIPTPFYSISSGIACAGLKSWNSVFDLKCDHCCIIHGITILITNLITIPFYSISCGIACAGLKSRKKRVFDPKCDHRCIFHRITILIPIPIYSISCGIACGGLKSRKSFFS